MPVKISAQVSDPAIRLSTSAGLTIADLQITVPLAQCAESNASEPGLPFWQCVLADLMFSSFAAF